MTDPFAAALDAYLDTDHPVPHALLVHGPWGAGKSTALRTYFDGKDPPVWISLFGLSTVPDIQRRVREAALPQGSGHLGAILGFVAGMEGGSFAAQSAQRATQGLLDNWADKLPADRPFVFDDLERFEGDLSVALGYLNLLTEEAKRQVIVVANEAELSARGDVEWDHRTEKLIGRRIPVRANAEAVFDGFATRRDKSDPVLPILTAHRETVLDTFTRTELGNLRSLSWALENLARVATVLADLPFEVPEEAVATIVTQVVAFTVEHRGGRIGEAEREMLSGRMELVREAHFKLNPIFNQTKKKEEAAKSDPAVLQTERARVFLDKHPGMTVGTQSGYLDYAILYALEDSGIVNAADVESSLKAHGIGNIPSDHSLLLHWHSLEADDLTRAIVATRNALERNEITDAMAIGRFAFIAMSLESLGDTRLVGPDAKKVFRRYLIEMARTGQMTGHMEHAGWIKDRLNPMLDRHATNPRRAAVTTSYRKVLDTLERAAAHRRWREGCALAKQHLDTATRDGPAALAPLYADGWDPLLHGQPVLNALDIETVAAVGSQSIAALDTIKTLLTRRDTQAHDAARKERPWVGRLLPALRKRVADWPAPLGELHAETVDELIRNLHAEVSFPEDQRAALGLPPGGPPQPGNNSDPSP